MDAHTRQEWRWLERCRTTVRRVVWDGDKILYEIQAPGGTLATAAAMEADVGLAAAVPVFSYESRTIYEDPTQAPESDATITPANGADGYYYGRVLYTHGGGIDAPLSVTRMEYSDSLSAPMMVFLHRDWRGTHDLGTYPDETCTLITTASGGGAAGAEAFCERSPSTALLPIGRRVARRALPDYLAETRCRPAGGRPPSYSPRSPHRSMKIHPDFVRFMESDVVVACAGLADDERVDAGLNEQGRRAFGLFRRNGEVWRVNADTRLGPLRIACDAARRGEVDDPFEETRTAKGTRRLVLHSTIRARHPFSYDHLYVYERG